MKLKAFVFAFISVACSSIALAAPSSFINVPSNGFAIDNLTNSGQTLPYLPNSAPDPTNFLTPPPNPIAPGINIYSVKTTENPAVKGVFDIVMGQNLCVVAYENSEITGEVTVNANTVQRGQGPSCENNGNSEIVIVGQ